jgi:hypothetical protein
MLPLNQSMELKSMLLLETTPFNKNGKLYILTKPKKKVQKDSMSNLVSISIDHSTLDQDFQ